MGRHKLSILDLVGKRFGRLLVMEFYGNKGYNHFWLCLCDCGNLKSIREDHLIDNSSKSCGCFQKEQTQKAHKTHGFKGTRFYNIWRGMKLRCLVLKNHNYKHYGGRGIKICDRWIKFENFRDDMYKSYLKHVEEFGESNTSIDRFIDVNGNYELANCKWSTCKEQSRNSRVSSKTENYNEHYSWQKKLQSSLNVTLRKNAKSCILFEEYIGCSILEFRKYIEDKFQPKMDWKNHGNGSERWQFDHIIGCNNFDLSQEEDRKKCFHYTNLQPLWWEDHIQKSRRRHIIL